MKSFIVNIISLSLIISILAFLVFYFVLPQYYLAIFPVMILFFIGVNIFVHYILTKAGKKNIRQFSTYYMGSIGIKLFIYLIFIISYFFINKKEHNMNFIIQFFILYIFYTFFETKSILKDLKKQEKS